MRITGGNFRLVERLFAQIQRVAQINEAATLTPELVEAAQELGHRCVLSRSHANSVNVGSRTTGGCERHLVLCPARPLTRAVTSTCSHGAFTSHRSPGEGSIAETGAVLPTRSIMVWVTVIASWL